MFTQEAVYFCSQRSKWQIFRRYCHASNAKMNLWLSKQPVCPLLLHWSGVTRFHHVSIWCMVTMPVLNPQT